MHVQLGAIHKLCRLGRWGGQKLPILLSKKDDIDGGGGQKSPILRRHSLWTPPYKVFRFVNQSMTTWHYG